MSYDYDDDEQNEGPKALRDLVKKLQRDLEKVTEERDSFASKAKEADLSRVFTDLKIPAHIQRWMKRDGVEADEAAVKQWVNENGADFNFKLGDAPAAVTETPEGQNVSPAEAPAAPAVESVLTPEDIAHLERIQGLMAGGVGQTQLSDAADTAVATVASQLGDNASFEEVIKALAAQGIPIESNFG